MGGASSEFSHNKISFITFNYDRSLEHFLFTALQNSYGASDEVIGKALDAIPIIHVHGQLGALPWQEPEGRPYQPSVVIDEHDYIRKAASSIRIIHESVQDALFRKAELLFQDARRVVFIGFGYDETNLNRLNIRKHVERNDCSIYGSCFGLTDRERKNVMRMLGGRITLGETHHGALQFLRESISLH